MNYLDEQVPGGLGQDMVGVVSAWGAHGACISLIRPRSLSIRDLNGHIMVTKVMWMGSTKYLSTLKSISHSH